MIKLKKEEILYLLLVVILISVFTTLSITKNCNEHGRFTVGDKVYHCVSSE